MQEIEQKEEFDPKPEQIAFASLYLDVSKKMTQQQMAQEIGVCRKTIWNWFKQPAFCRWINSQKNKILEQAIVDIYKMAVSKAKRGHYLFSKLVLELSGDYQPGMRIDTGGPKILKIQVEPAKPEPQQDNNSPAALESHQKPQNGS